MEKNTIRLLIGIGIAFVVIVGLVGIGCLALTYFYPLYVTRSTPAGLEALHTQAAQTFAAQLTQTAGAATATVPGFPPSPTTQPTAQPTATPTLPVPSPTPTPGTPTPVPTPCYWAKLEGDVTVKDGTIFPPGAQFTKIWRLRNIGSCSWTSDFLLVFSSGERMSGPQSSPIGRTVNPGETIDLSVNLVAPTQAGEYRGNWQLSTPTGQVFGLGSDQKGSFWVEINVLQAGKFAYDFAYNFCTAKWSTAAGNLPCPGQSGDADGFVVLEEEPVIEINRKENEPGLWMQPQHTNDGFIRGEYPAFNVKAGHRFKAIAACIGGAEKCDVIFRLSYRVGEGQDILIWEGREIHDGSFTTIDIDLTALAGFDVKFILSVLANGAPDGDQAFWLLPRIEAGN